MPDLETNDDYDGYTAEFIEGKPVTYRIAWVGNHADDEVIDGKQIETYYLSRSQLFTSIEEAQKYVDSSGICSSRKPIILRQVDNGAFELKVPRPVTAQVGMKNMSTYVIKQPFVDSIEEIKGVHHWCAYVSVNKRSPLYGMSPLHELTNLNVGHPEVNGDLNFGGKLEGQDQDLWFVSNTVKKKWHVAVRVQPSNYSTASFMYNETPWQPACGSRMDRWEMFPIPPPHPYIPCGHPACRARLLGKC